MKNFRLFKSEILFKKIQLHRVKIIKVIKNNYKIYNLRLNKLISIKQIISKINNDIKITSNKNLIKYLFNKIYILKAMKMVFKSNKFKIITFNNKK